MGEHGTWFDYLNRFSWWQSVSEKAEDVFGRKKPFLLLFQDSHFSLAHVLVTMLVVLFVVWGALKFKRGLTSADGGVAPLMLPIELVSHFARPVSLSLRLMGNMMADHKVVFAFFSLVPLFVPLPFLLLGLLVCVVQAIVFCTLTMVYIGMAAEHEEH